MKRRAAGIMKKWKLGTKIVTDKTEETKGKTIETKEVKTFRERKATRKKGDQENRVLGSKEIGS